MIFLTVGTQFPFDRLLKAVDDAFDKGILNENLYAQTGTTNYRPRNFEMISSLQKSEFDIYLTNASAVIGHAGMGTITATLEIGKPLLVMPRLRKFGEVVNDHQLEIAKRFEKAGLLLAAYTETDLAEHLPKLKTFIPQRRMCRPDAIVERISGFLRSIREERFGDI